MPRRPLLTHCAGPSPPRPISPPQLFMAQAGGAQDEAAIRKSIQAMKGMSDRQMEMMAKAAAVVSSGVERARAAKEWVASRQFFVIALAVLLLAVLLRWLGVM